MSEKIAAVRLRGIVGMRVEVEDTLKMLGLHRKNYCVVLDINKVTQGMLTKVKDFVTWGEINEETIALLKKKDEKKKFFRLHPPRGGFERKGLKTSYTQGGALGYRKEKINDLVRRMLP